MKILIADDQISTHQYLDAVIDWEQLGIKEIYHAYNGQETFDLLIDKKPDILILDIEMPKLNGIHVMKKIREIHQPETIIISAFDEFEYARDAVELGVHNYILKPIDPDLLDNELKRLSENVKTRHKQNIKTKISRLLHFGLQSEGLLDIQTCFSQLGIESFRVIYLKLLHPNMEKLLDVFKQMNNQLLFPNGSSELVIMQTAPRSNKVIQQINELTDKHRIEFFGGMSPISSNVKNIDKMIQMSKTAAKLGFYKKNTIHLYMDGQFEKKFDELLANNVVKKLNEGQELGYIDNKIKHSIVKLFDLAIEKLIDPIYLYNFCFKLLNTIDQVTPNLVEELNIYYSFENLLKEKHTFIELRTFLLNIIDKINILQKTNVNDQVALLERIKKYVESNYSEDISLNNISKTFHIDKYQLSKLFKEYFSINYWAYVTKVRMDKASELLLNTDLKNYQIAEKLGYTDESHFSRAFNKFYGTSPRKYAQKNK